MSLRFKAFGDGNCLYNSEAFSLIHAYRFGKLDPLFEDADFVKNMSDLLIEVSENNRDGIYLIPTLGLNPDKASVRKALDELIVILSPRGKIHWGMVQDVLADPLRKLVVKNIKKGVIRKEVQAMLTPVLRSLIEISNVRGSPELGPFFEGMPEIEQTMSAIISKNLSLKEKQDLFVAWFFGKDNKGFELYLNWIEKSGVHAGLLEERVLSFLFQHNIMTTTTLHPETPFMVTGFLDFKEAMSLYQIAQADKSKVPPLTFHFEHHIVPNAEKANHFNVFLPKNHDNEILLATYIVQHKEILARRNIQERIELLTQALKDFPSFDEHRQKAFGKEPMDRQSYQKIFRLTDGMFVHNIVPVLPKRDVQLAIKVIERKQKPAKAKPQAQSPKK